MIDAKGFQKSSGQKGRAGANEATNKVAPNRKIRAAPPSLQTVHTALP